MRIKDSEKSESLIELVQEVEKSEGYKSYKSAISKFASHLSSAAVPNFREMAHDRESANTATETLKKFR